jgi:diguanylate cyclase (GGDEF)-like protein
VSARPETADYATLSERMSNLLLLRIALAVIVLAWAAFRPEALGVSYPVLAGVTVGYLFVSIAFEVVRRRTVRAGFTILNSLLLLDGLYLAFAMYATGGTQSPMRFLIYLHLVAVSLLASYRTGLKLALWDSLLLFVVLYAQAAMLLPPVDTVPGAAIAFDSLPVLNVTAFWLFALATSIFSAMNERELRNRRADLEAIVDLGTALDAVGDPVHQARIVLDGLGERFDTQRGVVLGASDDRVVILAGRGVADLQSAPAPVDAIVQKAWERRAVLPIRRLDPQANPLLSAALPSARNLLVAPMVAEGMPVGAIVVEHRSRSVFGVERRVLSVLSQFAAVAALNFRNAVLLRSVQDLAERDSLTGAANRRMFQQALERTLASARKGSSRVTSVLFLDVDDFKVVNDSLGHAAGDALLVAVTERISALVREGDLVARLGGDEFAILTADDADLHRSRAMAERLVRELRSPYLIRDEQVVVTASIGIAGVRGSSQTAEEILRNADVAMYMAKANGKARFAIFDPGMHAAVRERHELGAQLQRAVELDQLRLVYQPIVELGSGRVAGLEALVRWQHPERGLITPGEFIEIAEENGAILPIGQWVLREACQHAGNWQREGLTPKGIFMCVNVSAREVQQPEFVASVKTTLEEAGVDPSTLMMEITETALLKASGPTMEILAELRSLGVRVVIDDFGTGYFSLSHLRQFPVDALKIASEFVQGSNTDARSAALAGAMVALSQSLSIATVAEGIETGEQAKRMESLGCTYGQGYFFASPMEQADIDKGVAGLATAVRQQRRRRTDATPATSPAPGKPDEPPTAITTRTRAPRTRSRSPRLMPADPTAA